VFASVVCVCFFLMPSYCFVLVNCDLYVSNYVTILARSAVCDFSFYPASGNGQDAELRAQL